MSFWIWRSPRLSELTLIIFNLELTCLGFEASILYFNKTCHSTVEVLTGDCYSTISFSSYGQISPSNFRFFKNRIVVNQHNETSNKDKVSKH